MDNLQFNSEDGTLFVATSAKFVFSMESVEEFVGQTGDERTIEDRFRYMTSAFMGAANATLFPSETSLARKNKIVDTAGTRIDRQSLDLMEEHQNSHCLLPITFIATDVEDSSIFSKDLEEMFELPVTNYQATLLIL